MKYVLVTTLGLALSLSAINAEAVSTGGKYKIYGYGGTNSGSNYRNYNRSGSSRYEGYSLSRYHSRSSRSNYNYYNRGRTTIQRYNDPTGDRWVEVRPASLPLPAGNYGKASNRLTYSQR